MGRKTVRNGRSSNNGTSQILSPPSAALLPPFLFHFVSMAVPPDFDWYLLNSYAFNFTYSTCLLKS